MLAPVTHILPLTTIRRERRLPVAGRVLVRKGQKVSPTDVIAEANLSPEHVLLEIARGLGLSEEASDRTIQRHVGDEVSEGDVIAGPVGLGRRVVRATRPGRVVLAGGGQVLIEVESRPFELKAGMSGAVSELFADRGAILEASGALVQGVWGNGRLDFGLLHILASTPDQELTPDRLDVSMRGSVVLGGFCNNEEVLTAANNLPLRGLILASMDARLVPLAMKMYYPIIIIEGFGRLPMNSIAYKLLSTSERREITVNAEIWDQHSATRPEVVIPLPSSAPLPVAPDTSQFSVGKQVRVVRAPHHGVIASLVALRPGLTHFPSGVRAPAAELRLESGEVVVLPLANLEALE